MRKEEEQQKHFKSTQKDFSLPLLRSFHFRQRTGKHLTPPALPLPATGRSIEGFLTPNGWSRKPVLRQQGGAALHGPQGHHIWPPDFPVRAGAAWAAHSGGWQKRQAFAAGCILSNLYKALKGIQWSNWEAFNLKWGWDLESTLEPAVWREVWGSISSVLISRELNINAFWHFYSSSPGVYTRLGFLFSFFFSFLCCFLHSEASS